MIAGRLAFWSRPPASCSDSEGGLICNAVSRPSGRVDLPGQREHRRAVDVCVPQPGEQVRRSRSGDRQARRRTAGQLAVRGGGERGGALVSDPDVGELARQLRGPAETVYTRPSGSSSRESTRCHVNCSGDVVVMSAQSSTGSKRYGRLGLLDEVGHWARQALAVEDDVHFLVVERDQPGDREQLPRGEVISPREIGVYGVARHD